MSEKQTRSPYSADLSAVDSGIEERWAVLPAGRMRYLHGGSGPPLLFVQGLLGYSFSWRFNLQAFSQRYTVFAPDLLGTGFSDHPPRLAGGMRDIAGRLLQFMDATGTPSADVIATSHGGAIGAVMAVEAPERVRRLVLVAPVNPWSAHARLVTRVLGTGLGALVFRLCAPACAPLYGYFLRRMYGDPRRIRPGTLEGYVRAVQVPGTLDYLLRVVAHWHADLHELKSTYGRLGETPVLLLWGDLDTAVTPRSATELQKRIRNSELALMKGVGHLPYEEVPEEFNRVVLEFLLHGSPNVSVTQ